MSQGNDADRLIRLRQALARRPAVSVPRRKESPSSPGGDEAAVREAAALASGGLEAEAAKREHGRTERFRDHVAIAILALFWIGFAGLVIAALAWCGNFFLSPEKQFLTPIQADRIITFLTGGGLTSFVSGYAKKRLT